MRSYIRESNPVLFTLRLLTLIVSSAHKAAKPNKFPVKDDARRLYPVLNGIEQKYEPTKVHLQVYDGWYLPSPVL
jgi:hypothetical protein